MVRIINFLILGYLDKKSECRRRDLNPRTTKDKALNLASLARLDYPCM